MPVTLDNARIESMANSGEMLTAFPFLGLRVEKKACCGRVVGHSPDFDKIREHVTGLPEDQKAKLKSMLQTDSVTVHVKVGNEVKAHTF